LVSKIGRRSGVAKPPKFISWQSSPHTWTWIDPGRGRFSQIGGYDARRPASSDAATR
jgi:hypothetical protein